MPSNNSDFDETNGVFWVKGNSGETEILHVLVSKLLPGFFI